MTKAVVLAAGHGKRMQDLTADRPKPMVLLNGRPILAHLEERLRASGFTEILLVTGYRAGMIEDYFRDRPGICFVRQATIDGTATAAFLARDFAADDPFLLTYGDILADAACYGGIGRTLERFP